MFKLIELTKRISIEARFFNRDLEFGKILLIALNKFMHNKVIPDAGLFIIVTEIDSVQVLPAIMNNAEINVQVAFKCLVFTLLDGETVIAKVKDCIPSGCRAVLPFYRSIIIDAHYLQSPSKFEYGGKRWIWIKKLGVDQYFFPINADYVIRMRVLHTKYNKRNVTNQKTPNEPMITYGSMNQDYLGATIWWSE